MISGAHTMIYSKNPEADRTFLRTVLGLPNADAGGGFLIFGTPVSEVAVHEAENNDVHELYFMCDDVNAFIAAMAKHGVTCPDAQDRGWGLATKVALPGGGKLGIYEPRHARPKVARMKAKVAARGKKRAARTAARKVKKKARRRR
jgi:catechol 2,3-dioxygenase-like lactoylglutathione lyase family enzyme